MAPKSTDLEAQPLTKRAGQGQGAPSGNETSTDIEVEDDLDPELDKELKKNGGQFESKFAVMQVTIRLPLDPNPLNLIALAYGFLPFMVPGGFFVYWAITRRFIPLFGLCLSLGVSIINEVILKPILKDPRPRLSANKEQDHTGRWVMKPGMPSGHVLNATVLLVWAVLEVAFKGPGLHDHADITIKWFAIIFLLMAPVPWARWYNSDHSLSQCLVAGSVGIVAGIAGYYVRSTYFKQHWAPWHLEEISVTGSNSTEEIIIATKSVVDKVIHHIASHANVTDVAHAIANIAAANSTVVKHHKVL